MKWIKTCIVILILGLSACGPSTVKPPSEPPRYEQVHHSVCSQIFRDANLGIKPGIITKDFTVGGILVGDFITASNYILPDTEYVIVDEDWFKRHIIPDFENFLWKNGIESYDKMRNDCDDFARAFTFYVRIKFRTMGFIKATPAIGDLHYSTPFVGGGLLGGGHAMNVGIFLNSSGEKVVRFIEPQTKPPSFVELDEETKKYYIKHLSM